MTVAHPGSIEPPPSAHPPSPCGKSFTPPSRALSPRAVEQCTRARVEIIYDRVLLEPSFAVLPFLFLVDDIGYLDCVEVSFLQCDDTSDSSRLGAAKEESEVMTDFNEFRNVGTIRPQKCFQRQFNGMGEKEVAEDRTPPPSFWNMFDGSEELIPEGPKPCRGRAGFVFILILQLSPRNR